MNEKIDMGGAVARAIQLSIEKKIVDAVKAVDPEKVDDYIAEMMSKFGRATGGRWEKGDTSHVTVSNSPFQQQPYHIANWHHGDDADFAETAHRVLPYMFFEINRLRELVDEKKKSNPDQADSGQTK